MIFLSLIDRKVASASAHFIVGYQKFLSPYLIEILKKNHLRIIAYTVNNETRIEQLTQWGVTGIITDEPELMWKVLRKL